MSASVLSLPYSQSRPLILAGRLTAPLVAGAYTWDGSAFDVSPRADLKAARTAWLAEAQRDPEELARREQSDFLAERNEAGEWFDFHSLRHTCGAWLSLSGSHPKTVQTVMRHSTPVLTMNRYGHMLPGAEAEAADRLGAMVSLRSADDDDQEITLKMTGTDPQSAQRLAQQLGRESSHSGAAPCNERGQREGEGADMGVRPKSLSTQQVTRDDAASCDKRRERRARDSNPQPVARHLNSNQLLECENAEEYRISELSAASGAAVSAEKGGEQAEATAGKEANQTAPMGGYDPDLAEVANRWATLPDAVRLAVMALVRSASR